MVASGHGELLKLGFETAQSSVAKYMDKRRGPPSQGWRTFLRNHAADIAAVDLFVVPTITFELLNGFVIVRLDRRELVWINVTTNPTAEWIARQLTEAFPWDEAPRYLIRDRGMKLVRFGAKGAERRAKSKNPANLRDLSVHLKEVTGDASAPESRKRLAALEPTLPPPPSSGAPV
jgi:hypothetical protein